MREYILEPFFIRAHPRRTLRSPPNGPHAQPHISVVSIISSISPPPLRRCSTYQPLSHRPLPGKVNQIAHRYPGDWLRP